jgi:hypothetical protein
MQLGLHSTMDMACSIIALLIPGQCAAGIIFEFSACQQGSPVLTLLHPLFLPSPIVETAKLCKTWLNFRKRMKLFLLIGNLRTVVLGYICLSAGGSRYRLQQR